MFTTFTTKAHQRSLSEVNRSHRTSPVSRQFAYKCWISAKDLLSLLTLLIVREPSQNTTMYKRSVYSFRWKYRMLEANLWVVVNVRKKCFLSLDLWTSIQWNLFKPNRKGPDLFRCRQFPCDKSNEFKLKIRESVKCSNGRFL